MSRLKRLIVEIHRRSLWQVLLIYVGGAWVCYEIIDTITDRLALPEWLPVLAIILFLIGLPVVLATAFVREVAPPAAAPPEAEPHIVDAEGAAARLEARRRHRLLTWRNTGLVFVFALALWGVAAAGWLVLGGERAAPAGPIDSLVVLPLDNLSGDPEQEYFVAGMHDALIGELAQIGALRVISRTSAMLYKDSGKSVPQIARELNVDAVVEGSVFRMGDSLRIQVQLIQALPEEWHVWAQTYDRDISDVLAMHSEVARAVAREVQVELTPQEETRLASARRVNPETYELYLKAMHHLNKFTPQGFETGLSYANQAIDSDPADPLAYAGLAVVYAIMGHDPRPPPQALPRAKAAALKALELDETLAEAHAALAEVRIYYDWDVAGAERSFHRALELNPNLAMAHGQYAWFLTLFGRWDEALAEQKRAQELDPLAPLFTGFVGWMYLWLERYEEALVEARRSLELNPNFPLGHWVMGTAYAGMGMYEESIAAHKKAGAASPGWGWGLGVSYALAGRTDEAREVLDELEKEVYEWDTWGIAEIYATLGDKEGALKWLEAAYEQRHSYIPWLNEFPAFEPLREDQRFQDLVRRSKSPN
jgi:TolB-like protein/tetratricopeptide (TPR) repeat protein